MKAYKKEYLEYIERCHKHSDNLGVDIQAALETLKENLGNSPIVWPCWDLVAMGFPISTLLHMSKNEFKHKRIAEIVDGVRQTPMSTQKIMHPYVDKFETVRARGYSMFFCGTNSLGKTYTALTLMRKIYLKGLKENKYWTVYYTTFFDLYELRNKGYHDPHAQAMFDTICSSDFLVVDEVGKQNRVTDSVIVFYEELVKIRTRRSLPSLYISNIPAYKPVQKSSDPFRSDQPEEASVPTIRTMYGESCYASMTEYFNFYEFSSRNPNMRLENRWTL